MQRTFLKLASGIVGLALLACGVTASATDHTPEAAGQARFMDYCAVCHGQDAKGNGPFANLLTTKPSDLTTLSQRSGGDFPFNRVYGTIDGRSMPGAHGTEQMPIWGGQWKSSASLGNETNVRGEILETILYLRSIQQ